IGRAVAEAVPAHERLAVDRFSATAGLGVAGVVDGVEVVAGRPAFLAERGLALPDDLAAAVAEAKARTAVVVGWDGRARAVAVVGDTVRPTSAAAIAELRRLGLHPVLLTGDNRQAAEAVAAQV